MGPQVQLVGEVPGGSVLRVQGVGVLGRLPWVLGACIGSLVVSAGCMSEGWGPGGEGRVPGVQCWV